MSCRKTLTLMAGVHMWTAGCSRQIQSADLTPEQPHGQLEVAADTVPQAAETESTDIRSLQDACAGFAAELAAHLPDGGVSVAVLPLLSTRGEVTPFSTYLADQVSAALLSHSLRVADRQHLKAILAEIDLSSAFAKPIPAPTITAVDALVLGRYHLGGGVLGIDIKAVHVRSNQLLLVRGLQVLPDSHVRCLALSAAESRPGGDYAEVLEVEGKVRITAAYTGLRADQLRLLDRVRQTVRRTLAKYLRDALGCDLSPQDVEETYRNGTEVDCRFEAHSVWLVMEFGAQRCQDDLHKP